MTPLLIGTLLALAFLLAVVGGRSVYRRAFRWHGWWGFWYRRYLDSAAWKWTRQQVLYRDSWICRHCGADCIWPEVGANVHHLCYHGWFWYALAPLLGLRENLDNLVTLCRDCHEKEHGR